MGGGVLTRFDIVWVCVCVHPDVPTAVRGGSGATEAASEGPAASGPGAAAGAPEETPAAHCFLGELLQGPGRGCTHTCTHATALLSWSKFMLSSFLVFTAG